MIDYDSKAVLSKFKIPSQRLQPFQQYHLELVDKVWERNSNFSGIFVCTKKDTSCFVSIRRKQHMCPEKSLEFVLCEMSDEINDNDLDGFTGRFFFRLVFIDLLAIFRPVSDILHYREAYMQDRARSWIAKLNPELQHSSSKKSLSLKVRIGVLSTSSRSTCSAKVRARPATHRLDFLKECFVTWDKNSCSILKNAQAHVGPPH